MHLLLDSSVLIDALRLRRGRRQWLAELVRGGHTLATSALNIAEVYAGMRPQEDARTKAFLNALPCYEITASVAEMAGNLKKEWEQKGRTLTLADTIVAAVALQKECALATDNRKDFPMPRLQLYELPEEDE
jgi:predicted nucleic acid-binding protein